MNKFWLASLAVLAPFAAAQPTEIRVQSETAPPGGIAQFHVGTTEADPIVTGSGSMSFDESFFGDVAGVGMTDNSGDNFGVALKQGNRLRVVLRSRTGVLGLNTDYPLFVVAIPVRANIAPGASVTVPFDIDARTFRAPDGSTYDILTKPSTFTAGGASINLASPRAGTVAGAQAIDFSGTNFVQGARVRLDNTVSQTTFVSSSLLRVVPQTPFRVDGSRIRLDNGDGSQDVHYSYRKGTPVQTSSVPLIRDAEPLFPDAGPAGDYYTFAFSSGATRTAIALQNPGTTSTSVSIQGLSLSLTPSASATVNLPPNGLVFLDAGELVPGAGAATILRLRVTQPVQMLQMIYTSSGFASPSLPQRLR